MNTIEIIAQSCDCSEEHAKELRENQLGYLRECLFSESGLSYSDIEYACYDLGLSIDNCEDFIDSMLF